MSMDEPREEGDGDEAYDEAFWRDFLTHPDSMIRVGRRIFSRIPSSPRCQQCAAPFTGPGAPVMRLLGKRQSDGNPNMCTTCHDFMIQHHGGAEVEASLLFADVRGSTALAETMSAGAFRNLMDRFYTAATGAVFGHDGIVDKFVGDELVAVFPPHLSGENHPAQALETARALLRATGHADRGGPWIPVGAGVHTGRMWFGAVGVGGHTEVTVLGDTVNTTARLAAAAGAGEILVSAAVATAAGLDPDLERRSLELKGKTEATEVVTVRVGPA
jgi:adenylate cyclase